VLIACLALALAPDAALALRPAVGPKAKSGLEEALGGAQPITLDAIRALSPEHDALVGRLTVSHAQEVERALRSLNHLASSRIGHDTVWKAVRLNPFFVFDALRSLDPDRETARVADYIAPDGAIALERLMTDRSRTQDPPDPGATAKVYVALFGGPFCATIQSLRDQCEQDAPTNTWAATAAYSRGFAETLQQLIETTGLGRHLALWVMGSVATGSALYDSDLEAFCTTDIADPAARYWISGLLIEMVKATTIPWDTSVCPTSGGGVVILPE